MKWIGAAAGLAFACWVVWLVGNDSKRINEDRAAYAMTTEGILSKSDLGRARLAEMIGTRERICQPPDGCERLDYGAWIPSKVDPDMFACPVYYRSADGRISKWMCVIGFVPGGNRTTGCYQFDCREE